MRYPKTSLVLAVALTLSLAGSAFAAGISVGGYAGIQSYTGDAAEGWKSGLLLGATGDLALTSSWSVGANVTFATSKHDDDGADAAVLYPPLTGTISDELKIMQFGVHAKYFLPLPGSPVHPYLLAGAGMYQAKVEFSADSYSESSDETDLGFRGGVGANFAVNPMVGIGAEADYHVVQTEGESTTFYGLKAGLVFHLGAR